MASERQVLTFRTRAWLSFAPPTCRMAPGQYQGIPQADPEGRVTPRFCHRLISFRHFIGGLLALASLNRACRNRVPASPQRSPPLLLTTAACGGLRSAPDCRSRRALLHLSYSYAPPFGPAALVTHDPLATVGALKAATVLRPQLLGFGIWQVEIRSSTRLPTKPCLMLLSKGTIDRDGSKNTMARCPLRHARPGFVYSRPTYCRPGGVSSGRDLKAGISADSWGWAFCQYRHLLSRSYGSVCGCGRNDLRCIDHCRPLHQTRGHSANRHHGRRNRVDKSADLLGHEFLIFHLPKLARYGFWSMAHEARNAALRHRAGEIR